MHDLSELSTTIIPVVAAAAAAAVVVAEAAFFISVMSREAPELCKSDVPGRNVAVCFPFILPCSEGKPKRHLSDSVVVDRTRSSHSTET